MGNLQFLHERLFPTDLLFKNFFDSDSQFNSYVDSKPSYPVDIATVDNGLVIEIAAVGIDKSDMKIETSENQLKVIYEKGDEDSPEDFKYIHRGIARRAFNIGWKISPKYNLNNMTATMEKGLLSLFIPVSEDAKPKTITIK
jgi:HSP20 family molecular chaperone IbpA